MLSYFLILNSMIYWRHLADGVKTALLTSGTDSHYLYCSVWFLQVSMVTFTLSGVFQFYTRCF